MSEQNKVVDDVKVVNGVTVDIDERDDSGYILKAHGATTPTSTSAGFATGAEFANTTTDKVLVNEGDETSCDFQEVVAGEIDASDLGADSVDSDEIAADAVGASEIAADAVGSSEIAADAVGSSEIAADAVGSAEIAADAVGTSEIADGSVANADIGADAVDGTKIADDSVDSEHIAADSIDSEHYAAGSVDSDAIGADAVGASELADNAVDNAAMADNAVGNAEMADNAVGSAEVQDGTLTASDLHNDARKNVETADLSALPAPSASDQLGNNLFAFKAPMNARIDSVELVSDTATSGSDATNHYEVEVYNATQANSLSSAKTSTVSNEIVAETPWAVTVDQNQDIQNDDVIQVRVDILDDGSAAPTDLSTAEIRAVIAWSLRA